MKRILFRADGSKEIGMGHLNRSSIIGKEFILNGSIIDTQTITIFPHDIIEHNISFGMLGDINGDGFLNVLDVVLIVNQILSNEYYESSDLNSDDALNILDIVQLVNLILG